MPDVNAAMMVIRKRLSATEISDPDFRTEDGVVQQTSDGGITWIDSPANDVRHADAWRLPPINTFDPKCQAAANMSRFVANWLESLLPVLSAAGSAWALLSSLILLFVVLGPFALVVIMLDVAATLLGIGASAISGAFDSEVFDTLTCIFYNNIGEDGQVSSSQLADINTDVDSQLDTIAAAVLHLVFGLVGEVGVSNWGIRGDAPADCEECGGCVVDDFDEGSEGWTVVPPGSWSGGAYSAGAWRATNDGSGASRDVYIEKTFSFTTITGVSIEYTYSAGEHDDGSGVFQLVVGASSEIEVNAPTPAPASPVNWTGSISGNTVQVFIACSRCDEPCSALTGNVAIEKITVCGE